MRYVKRNEIAIAPDGLVRWESELICLSRVAFKLCRVGIGSVALVPASSIEA